LPTVTDANLLLGYISSTSLAGGALTVDMALAETAVRRHVSELAGLPLLEAAYGIHVVANSNMVRAIKSVSVERGRDPAAFVMMAFGGAGPIHAAGVARTLGVRQVLIPPAPGVFSAMGLLRAEIEHHAARTVLLATDGTPDLAAVDAGLEEMRADLLTRVREEGLDEAGAEFARSADLRYRGQSSEMTVPIPPGPLTPAALRSIEARFEQEFEQTYGHRGDTKAFELVTVRLVMRVPRAVEHGTQWASDAAVPDTRRLAYFGPQHGWLEAAVLSRNSLGRAPRPGPALIQEYDTTIVVPPGCTAALDAHGNVLLAIAG
jgi:N-methylhydantoinase A